MAILPIELEPLSALPDPSQHNRALVLYRGDLCYAYNSQWYRVMAKRQAMGRFTLTGYVFGGSSSSVIQSFNMVIESATQISTTLPANRWNSACIHTSTKAYIGGGFDGGRPTTIFSFRFYGESAGVLSATISLGRYSLAAIRDVSKGFYSGGVTTSDSNVIDKLVYSSETCGAISAVLSSARARVAGIRSDASGYTCGPYTAVDKLSFSTETNVQVSHLQQSRESSSSGSTPNIGYIMQGNGRNTFEEWRFSTDTSSLQSSVFSSSSVTGGGVNSYTRGYILYTMASGRIEGIIYNTSTVFQTTAQMVSNLTGNAQSSCQTGGIL